MYNYTHGFTCITNESVPNTWIGQTQLLMHVSANVVEDGWARFTFHNVGQASSSITDIYFYDGALFDHREATLSWSGDVQFSKGAAPPDLPGWEDPTRVYSADSDPPTQPNGVNPREWLGITFALYTGDPKRLDDDKTYADVIADLGSGALRIGIKVQGFADGGSESFINNPYPVPTPEAVLLGMLGLVAAGLKLRRLV
jgi:hypothetical protein